LGACSAHPRGIETTGRAADVCFARVLQRERRCVPLCASPCRPRPVFENIYLHNSMCEAERSSRHIAVRLSWSVCLATARSQRRRAHQNDGGVQSARVRQDHLLGRLAALERVRAEHRHAVRVHRHRRRRRAQCAARRRTDAAGALGRRRKCARALLLALLRPSSPTQSPPVSLLEHGGWRRSEYGTREGPLARM